MLSEFSDHHSFSSARRSLFISSCLVILISATEIKGETIQVLGLGLTFSQPKLIFLLRIVSAYLLWAFIWSSLVEYYPKLKVALIESREKTIEKSLQETKRIEDEIETRREDQGYHELDPWWEGHYDLEIKERKEIARFEKIERMIIIGRLFSVDVLPVTIIAVFAIFLPNYLASMLTP